MADAPPLAASEQQCDVGIVGGGLAGLMAAYQLGQNGYSVRLFEAQSMVGGRVKDIIHSGGDSIELGANWFSPDQPLISELVDRFGLTTFETRDAGDHIFVWDKTTRRFRGKLPPLGPLKLLDIGFGLWKFDRLARSLANFEVWGNGDLAGCDSQSFEYWIDTNLTTRAGKEFFHLLSEMVFGAEPRLLSLLYVMFYAARSTSLSSLITVKNGHQGLRFRDGPSSLSEALMKALPKHTVLPNHPVSSIELSDDHVVAKAAGRQFRCKTILMAVPPAAVGQIAFAPSLPPARNRLLKSMPMGRVIKVQLVYKRAFWCDAGLSGQVMTNGYPLTYLIDNSPPDGGSGVLAGFVCSSRAERLMSESQPEATIASAVETILGIDMPAPLSVHIEDWASNRWIGGSYGAYCPPGVMTTLGCVRDAQDHPIYWCGAEFGQTHPCQMEGALESGQRTARQIQEALAR